MCKRFVSLLMALAFGVTVLLTAPAAWAADDAQADGAYILGDVTGDGFVNNKDYARLKAFLADDTTAMTEQAADLNQDGRISNKDLARLKKILAQDVPAGGAYASSGEEVEAISTLLPDSTIWLDDTGAPLQYVQKLTGSATAYYDAYNTGLTASGMKPQKGCVAVDPKKIPYGTQLYIRSADGSIVYGYAVAADTGGFVSSGKTLADLYFDTYDECIQWGRRDIELYILRWPS